MSKNDRTWIPDAVDLDWIESLAMPPEPALTAIEAAAQGPNIPIVDRDAGRVLRVLAGTRRRKGSCWANADANTCVATRIATSAATIGPQSTASRPARPCSISAACSLSPVLPTLSTSAQATPSG